MSISLSVLCIVFSSYSVRAQDLQYRPSIDNCGIWSDDVPLKPILLKWLRGEKLENVPYCSKTAIKATAFNSSNVTPQLIDLNGDGENEIALRYLCSPTGNCAMNIYKRSGKFYKLIFRDRKSVQWFEKRHPSHNGFADLRTYMHGSCCDGDFVVYRFNAREYQPIACGDYSYRDKNRPGETVKKRMITHRPCKQVLDPST